MLHVFARRVGLWVAVSAVAFSAAPSSAALILNAAKPIHERIGVRLIQVADNSGANAAPLFGTPTQQATVFGLIDQIWAQAGIDIDLRFRAGTYNSTFALTGTPGANNPRPQNDLNTIRSNALAAGNVIDPDATIVNVFITRIVPGFPQTTDNTSNGLSYTNGTSGVAYWAGPNLPSFTGGQEALAAVLAHEIGHNLGLQHIVEAENLMQAGGSPNLGQRLNASQISTAQHSSFSVVLGDTDLDKDVDFNDLVVLAQHYSSSTTQGIAFGDIDRNGQTNFDDLVILAQNYGFTLGLSSSLFADSPTGSFDGDWKYALSLVPEPTTVALLTAAVTIVLPRRRPAEPL